MGRHMGSGPALFARCEVRGAWCVVKPAKPCSQVKIAIGVRNSCDKRSENITRIDDSIHLSAEIHEVIVRDSCVDDFFWMLASTFARL